MRYPVVNRWQRAGMIAIAARGDAAEIDVGGARPGSLEAQGRQEAREIIETLYLQLVELGRADRGNGNGYLLQAFGAAFGGDDDLTSGIVVGCRDRHLCQRRGGSERRAEHEGGAQSRLRCEKPGLPAEKIVAQHIVNPSARGNVSRISGAAKRQGSSVPAGNAAVL